MAPKVKRESSGSHSILRPLTQLVEDYRQGYPRLAVFLTLDRNFTIVKRFNNLHMRVLLEQQDKLVELEEKLNHCDDQDKIQLNLSSRRQNINRQRRELLDQIKHELKDYGMRKSRSQAW
jgi:dsDNA-specific endonuclease/ATPase MutS2